LKSEQVFINVSVVFSYDEPNLPGLLLGSGCELEALCRFQMVGIGWLVGIQSCSGASQAKTD
jgi:hypothetical protein